MKLASEIIFVKASAVKVLCESMQRYTIPRLEEKVADGVLSMLKSYKDDELFPMSIDIYEDLVMAEKKKP